MGHTGATTVLDVLQSPRVAASTRRVLERRLAAVPKDYRPTCISLDEFATLERLLSRLFPDDEHGAPGANELSLAARLERRRAHGKGNGWRYAGLPPDAEALRKGLEKLDWSAQHRHRRKFVDLTEDRADALLHRVQNGEEKWESLDASRWFEEILADATEIYVSHPVGMESMGFAGFADEPAGWPGDRLGVNNTESWEPKAKSRG